MKVKSLTSTCRWAGAILIALSGALGVRASDYPTTVLSYNPLGYWRLNEAATSPALHKVVNSGTVGSAGDGYIVLDVGMGQAGVIGTCARFNNPGTAVGHSGSKIDVPYNAGLNPTAPFSVEMWVKPNDTGTDSAGISDCPLSSFDPNGFGGGNRSGWLFYLNHAGAWQFRLGLTSGYAATVFTSGGNAVNGVWQHIVATYDGTTARVYANGVLIGSAASGSGWKPNPQMALRMGGTPLTGDLGDVPWIAGTETAGNRGFDGWLDEVAIYPTALSQSTIAAHYDAAKPTGGTNVAGYAAQIAASSPLGYWHLDEAAVTAPDPSTFPVVANSGSVGSAADGTNMWGSLAGQTGSGFAGLGAGNKASFFDGENGWIALKDAAGLHFSGNITMMAWIKPTAKDFFRDIIAHGWDDSYRETFLRISRSDPGDGGGTSKNYYELGVTDGADATYYDATLFEIPAGDFGNWVHIAGTYDGANWNLYRNGALVATLASANGALDITNAPWSIGARNGPPSPTSAFSGVDLNLVYAAQGLFFGGSIDEPAVFSTALSASDIAAIYNSAQASPQITRAVQNPGSIFKGSSSSFDVWAEGAPTVSYLWLSNGVSTGVTATNITINNFAVGSQTIAVSVSNPYGSVTSSVTFSVVAAAPSFPGQPASETRYVGRPFSFSVTPAGSTPLTLQWKTNGVAIPGATSTTYSGIASAASAGTYVCTASNEVTQVDSQPATLTVLTVPGGYASAVTADGPIAYWRLGESSGTIAHDYWGGIDGTYSLSGLGQPGYSEIDPDTAVAFNGTNSHVANISGVPDAGVNFAGHTNFSLEAWVNAQGGQADEATIIAKGIGAQGTSATEQFSLDVSAGVYRFFTRGASPTMYAATALSGPDGTWQHVVGVYDDAGGHLYIYVNGVLEGSATTRPAGVRASSDPVSIGSKRLGNDPFFVGTFDGVVDEVSVYNYALSQSQVNAHYSAAYGNSLQPKIAKQPASQTYYETFPATISVDAFGTQPLTYQWKKGGVDLTDGGTISGSTTRTLVIDPVALTDAGNYTVTINNTVGPATNSAVAVLTVLKAPTNGVNVPGLVLHLPFNGSLSDTSGRNNNGSGVHVTVTSTNTASPSAGNPDFNYVADGMPFGKKGLHYASYTTSGSNVVTGGAMTNAYFVTLGKPTDLNFSSNVNFSVAFWIRFPAFNGQGDLGDLPFLCSSVGSYGNPGMTFAPSYNLGSWSYSMNGNVQLYGPQYILDDGAWHHMAHTFDRNGLANTYMDGRKVDFRSANTIGDLNTGNTVNIGQDPTGSYQEQGYYDIDDMGVWRRALTGLEVASIYLAATNASSSFIDITPSVKAVGNQVTVTFQAGTLQQADNVSGPYTDVVGATPPTYTTTATTKKFYRTKWNQ